MFTRPTTLTYHFSRFDPPVRPQGCSCKNFVQPQADLLLLTGTCTVQHREQLVTLLTGTIRSGSHLLDFLTFSFPRSIGTLQLQAWRHICTIGKRVDGRRLAEPTTARYQLVSFFYLLLACLLIRFIRFDSDEIRPRTTARQPNQKSIAAKEKLLLLL